MRRGLIATAAALLIAGCGDDAAAPPPDPADERSDKPAKPPPGYRKVQNARAGFTVSVPRTWAAATKGRATLIRSDDQLVAITIAADRSAGGRDSDPAAYARETLRELPGFSGEVSARTREVARSPYVNAIADGRGRVTGSARVQRISVAAFTRPGQVTYSALIFRNARVRPRFNDPVIERLLRSFRAQPPDNTP